MYAIIETGGKQYRVIPGQTIDVERLDVAAGGTVALDKVLLVAGDDKVTVGQPTIAGARVMATSRGEHKGRKIIVFRYKSKARHRNKIGHRQLYTRLVIDKIEPEAEAISGEPKKRVRRRKVEVEADGT